MVASPSSMARFWGLVAVCGNLVPLVMIVTQVPGSLGVRASLVCVGLLLMMIYARWRKNIERLFLLWIVYWCLAGALIWRHALLDLVQGIWS